jgi:hypothetical protein
MEGDHAAGRNALRRATATAFVILSIPCPQSAAEGTLQETDCGGLDISLEPMSDFRFIECEAGGDRGGGSSGVVSTESIEAHDALSFIVVFYDRAGTNTYLRQVDPRLLFGRSLKLDIDDSWSGATMISHRFNVRTFFGKLESQPDKVPCFAFSRYIQRVPQTTGYRHMVGGIYCEIVPSDEPVTRARIDQMTGKIRGDMF